MSELLAIPVTALASYAHGQEWATVNLVRLGHFCALALISWLAGLELYVAVWVALLATSMFWLTMRRSDEAKAEIDGYSGANGGYHAWRITRHYVAPVASVSLMLGGLYGFTQHDWFLLLCVLLLASLAVPACIIRWAKGVYARSNGADDPRGVTEAVIGAFPCGVCLASVIHAAGVLYA